MAGKLPPPDNPRGSAGKRGPSGPIVTTSDEEENTPIEDLPKISTHSKSPYSKTTCANTNRVDLTNTDHDTDYECISSPGNSSTASGPIYVRPPGFTHRATEVTKPRVKKKKTASVLLSMREASKERTEVVREAEVVREVEVVRQVEVMRTKPKKVLRPITPPADDTKEKLLKKPTRYVSEWKIVQADSDSLFRLFDKVSMEKPQGCTGHTTHRRYRPRRTISGASHKPGLLLGNDPNMMDAVSDKLLPQLSIERRKQMNVGNTSLQLITLGAGDKSVTLPTLTMEQNYSQILSELVMTI